MYQSTIFGTSVRPRAPPKAVPFQTRPETSWNGRVEISAPAGATPTMIDWPPAAVVTPLPTSTTTPAPSWPRIAGNKPSGSAPERVNSSVWQIPVALISTSTSPAPGPSRETVSMVRGAPALRANAARTSMNAMLPGARGGRNESQGTRTFSRSLGTNLLDEIADLFGGRKDDRRPIALHAGSDDHRLAGIRAE